jgi:hypothetical protein
MEGTTRAVAFLFRFYGCKLLHLHVLIRFTGIGRFERTRHADRENKTLRREKPQAFWSPFVLLGGWLLLVLLCGEA